MIEALVRGFWKAVIVTALIAGLAYAWPARDTDPDAVRQQSGNTVLYDHRDECWAGVEPAHVDMPTHAVMRVEGVHNSQWFYAGPFWTKAALRDVFEKDSATVYVIAFCE